MIPLCAVFLLGMLTATPVMAQTYVSAVLGADLTKSYRSTVEGQTFPDAESEAIGWGLRVGVGLGSRWGVELDFNRPSEIDAGFGPVYPVDQFALPSVIADFGVYDFGTSAFGLLSFTPQVETTQRNTTWNAVAWVTQPLGSRSELAFLAGVGFSKVTQESSFSYGRIAVPLIPIPRSFRSTTVMYGVGPVVGVDARIRMTDRLVLTPSFRAQSLGNDIAPGLVLRPSVALGWMF